MKSLLLYRIYCVEGGRGEWSSNRIVLEVDILFESELDLCQRFIISLLNLLLRISLIATFAR
jgi:hypothetical protein